LHKHNLQHFLITRKINYTLIIYSMARKKNKCNLFFMILIAILLITFFLIQNNNENFTNTTKENFDNIRSKNTCGTCSLNN